jgi:ABC-2 type transport system permease protein
MLWYKSWLETRWRFWIGLAILMLAATGTVLAYPRVVQMMPVAAEVRLEGEIGRRVAEVIALSREYRGYVWVEWFRQNMPQQIAVFAVVLGTGGLLAQATRGGALFTLALPVSRRRLTTVRAATGLGELLVLALVPSLLFPLLSPTVAERYAIGDALVHALCMFGAGTVFFALAFFLSTIFSDLWRPALIALCAAACLSFVETVLGGRWGHGIFGIMTAEQYFRAGEIPWLGLLVCAGLSAAMFYAALRNIATHDF